MSSNKACSLSRRLAMAALGASLALIQAAYAAAPGGIDGNQPVAIESDSLEVIQSSRRAIFQGNVIAKQGEMTLRSQQMTVFYAADKNNAPNTKAGSAASLGALKRIEVNGEVRLQTPGESAQAQRGRYDAQNNKLYLFGDVILKREGNRLQGSRLVYDLTSGSSLLSSDNDGKQPKSSGRVKGVFTPSNKNTSQGQ